MEQKEAERNDWWKHAVVYQIYPKSFQDSNGDGMGDLRGITARLPYLKELGVNMIWLCPVYQSPMDDGGYDIADYFHVDPMFGTDEDLDELICKAGDMGIRILMDLVINHTSDEHSWFQEALKRPDSRYGNYYIFKETEDGTLPNNWRSYFGGPAWERIGDTNRFYLHAFSKKQPDLNWENEEVREELYQMINYWLGKGLGGFRVDAICNIKKRMEYGGFPPDGEDGLRYMGDWILNQPGIETFLEELSRRTFRLHNSMTVAEADVPDELLHRFIGENGFFSMVFDFSYTDIDLPDTGEWFKSKPFIVSEFRDRLFHSQVMVQEKGWGAVYLENHDQNRSVNKYIPMEDRNDYSKTMLGCLFLMLRGTPFIYQGQEIGMENIHMDCLEEYDDIATKSQYARALEEGMGPKEALAVVNHRSRDNSRTPMQWDDSENAGFSPAGRTWLKVNPNYKNINAKQQMEDPKSVLNFYKKLIALRKDSPYAPLIVDGRFIPYETEDDSVIAYERAGDGESLLVILNFQNKDSVVKAPKGYGKKVIGNYDRDFCPGEEYSLRPYECVVLWKGEYGQQ